MPIRIVSLVVALLPLAATAQETHPQIPLWPRGAPGFEDRRDEKEELNGSSVRNVHNPSLTVYLPPKDKANGAAVVVCPGGGFRQLVMAGEGYEPAEYLNSLGVAAFVLKYRLPREPNSPYDLNRHPREDGQRAIRLVRSRATEWNIDPERVGILGFSAGGEVVSVTAYDPGKGDSAAADPIDRMNGRPNFQILVYPGPLGVPETVPADAPPAFLVVANDDGAANVVMGIAQKYRAAKRPVEAHILSRGGHGFHMGKRSRVAAVQVWPQRLAEWLDDSFILDPTKRAEEERRAKEEAQRKKKKA